jgi:flagellar hook-associated protein 2
VHIIKAASKASITGSVLTGSLSQDTNLTITDSNGLTAQLVLKSGSNISDIVDAINAEVSDQKQQILVGSNQLYADEGKASFISADTKLNSIYDENGNPVALANGDNISFSGTDRSGNTVMGSFAISDTSTQTVGDLLSSINNAYGAGYSASIDSQGRITIKDLTAGTSELALNITSDSLDFGTIGVNPTAGDGSQSGRYAMDITASDNNGALELTSNSYGDHNFTVTTTGQDLGIASTSSGGNDVKGEIRLGGSSTWMTMTGSGQTLTGDANQGVDGLEVKYTGTSAGTISDSTNTFDFTFTKGVGSVLSQALEQMSDSVTGYVTKTEQSLQTQMSNIDKNISDMEERITQDQEAMTQKYVQMETLISQLQSQSSWLTSQINSLTSNSSMLL